MSLKERKKETNKQTYLCILEPCRETESTGCVCFCLHDCEPGFPISGITQYCFLINEYYLFPQLSQLQVEYIQEKKNGPCVDSLSRCP